MKCSEGDTASALLSIPEVGIKNPSALFIDMATIVIRNRFEADIDKLAEDIVVEGRTQYEKDLRNLIDDYHLSLKNRYVKKKVATYKAMERRYPIDNKIVLSRMQRALSHYKYEESKSLFTFTDKVQTKYNVDSNILFTVNIFPEANGYSAIVYEITYDPIVDTFLKTFVFGENNVIEYLNGQIAIIEKVIK